MIAPSRDHPSPHDWPEDWADPAEDNGGYLHVCVKCKTAFTGHKHRADVCKVCSQNIEDEAKRRKNLLVSAGLNPMEWVLMSAREHHSLVGALSRYIMEAGDERDLRRKLAAALKVADSTNSNVAYWGHPGRHRDTSEALLAESDRLDDPQRNLKKEA